MQAMIDHAAALIVGGSIIFILAALLLRGQDLAINSVQVDSTRGSMRVLVDMLEQDLVNMGSGMLLPNQPGDLANPLGNPVITRAGTEGGYEVLEFRGLAEPVAPPATPTVQDIRYRWRQEGTAWLNNGSEVPTYRVERLVDGVVSGTSFDNVTSFSITLLRDDHSVITPPSSEYHLVRYLDVSVAMVSPLGTDELIEQSHWHRRFRPVNLNHGGATVLRIVTGGAT